LKQLRDEPLHRETAVENLMQTFEGSVALNIFDNAEWIRPQGVEMFLNHSPCEIRKARKFGSGGNQ
jgi:hypothetical protein